MIAKTPLASALRTDHRIAAAKTLADTGSRLPQSGVWFDDELAQIFQVEVATIREWVYRTGIPHIPAFRGLLIDVADIFGCAKVTPPKKPVERAIPRGRNPRGKRPRK